uniref:Zgc:194246 n=1 Tax=Cyprinus carpio TaxID=7962 RepID=A0A8C2IDR3_CYPCA
MSDDISSAQLCENITRESLHLNQHLEKMTEQMENVSVKLSWMAYDMVVLRTSPDLAESFKSLENEFLKWSLREIPQRIVNIGPQMAWIIS